MFLLVGAALLVAVPLVVDLPRAVDFSPNGEDDGLKVEIFRPPGTEPWVRSEVVINQSVDAVRKILTAFGQYGQIFSDDLRKVTVLESLERGARMHLVWSLPFPFSDRDAVVRYEEESLPNGGFRLRWQDDAHGGDPQTGVRIARAKGETRVSPLPAGRPGVKVEFMYYGDLGGDFPGWIKESAWKQEPGKYFAALRRALEKK